MRIGNNEFSFTPFSVGSLFGIVFSVLIFYIDASLARNFLGFLIGSCFSPAFTSERTDSRRYYVQAYALIGFTLMILAGFRFPLVIAFLVLALSTGVEAEGKGMVEAAKRVRKEEKE